MIVNYGCRVAEELFLDVKTQNCLAFNDQNKILAKKIAINFPDGAYSHYSFSELSEQRKEEFLKESQRISDRQYQTAKDLLSSK